MREDCWKFKFAKMYIFIVIFNDTVNVWLNFFGLHLKNWKFIQSLYRMQFVFIIALF